MILVAEMPVRDQPVACAIGVNSTGSVNIAPMITQRIRPPAATTAQRWAGSDIACPFRQRSDTGQLYFF